MDKIGMYENSTIDVSSCAMDVNWLSLVLY